MGYMGSKSRGVTTMKKVVTKPLKNADKHEDGLLECLLHNKKQTVVQKQLQPSKSYIRR